MPEEFQRRLPSTEREIASIQAGDIRVSVIGTVIDKNEEGTRLVLDDGTGKVSVTLETPAEAGVNQMVRVFGRVIPLEKGVELQGELVQDMSKLDMAFVKKVKGLKM